MPGRLTLTLKLRSSIKAGPGGGGIMLNHSQTVTR